MKNSAPPVADRAEIWEVMLDHSTIQFHEPLLIPFTVLDRGIAAECYCAEIPEIGVAVGINLEELTL